MKKKYLTLFFLLFFFVSPSFGETSIIFQEGTAKAPDYTGSDGNDSFFTLPFELKFIALGAIILGLGWKLIALLTAWAKKDPNNENR
ncbi:MAG: hypothetical protein PWQ44_488, partial [Methanolobus sp.]|nr:hypothetical protein [Methanolobus sp.]